MIMLELGGGSAAAPERDRFFLRERASACAGGARGAAAAVAAAVAPPRGRIWAHSVSMYVCPHDRTSTTLLRNGALVHRFYKRFRDSEKTERKRYTGVHFWRVFAKSAPQKSLFLRTRMQVAEVVILANP